MERGELVVDFAHELVSRPPVLSVDRGEVETVYCMFYTVTRELGAYASPLYLCQALFYLYILSF
jgi:hypothetical protein